jgi:hypothetical protein
MNTQSATSATVRPQPRQTSSKVVEHTATHGVSGRLFFSFIIGSSHYSQKSSKYLAASLPFMPSASGSQLYAVIYRFFLNCPTTFSTTFRSTKFKARQIRLWFSLQTWIIAKNCQPKYKTVLTRPVFHRRIEYQHIHNKKINSFYRETTWHKNFSRH